MKEACRDFSPIWLTSDRQLEGLAATYQSASLWSKMIGRYAPADDLTSVRGLFMPWMRAPTVMVAQGRLSLEDGKLAFRPNPYRAFGWATRGPHQQLAFELRSEEIVTMEWTDFRSPVLRAFDLPFVRLVTTRSDLLGNFLLCVGGRFSVPRIRENTRELGRALQVWRSPPLAGG
jgi:hypothetical protein